MPLIVNEIFHSLQGESTFAGLGCVMVRLTGCNLRCAYCDTPEAYDTGTEMAMSDILGIIGGSGCRRVEITGGEPLLQEGTPKLIDKLVQTGHIVLLETNGTLDISVVNQACVIIMDIKCPSSGESRKSDRHNLERLRPHDQVKFVIADETDYCFARQISATLIQSAGNILFSPVDSVLQPARLAEWMIQDRLEARLQLQLHKIIWPGETRR